MKISLKELVTGTLAGKYKAISFREELTSVDPGHIISPPTFAGEEKGIPKQAFIQDGDKLHVYLDTHQSQANRIEPLLEKHGLVPQKVIQTADRKISVTELGHRAADARLRFSSGAELAEKCFGDLELMAKNFPTTLLFGGWDSRGAGVKVARSVRTYVIAQDVVKVPKFGQYVSSFTPDEKEEMALPNKALSVEGIPDCPATSPALDVMVRGGIFRYGAIALGRISRLSSAEYILSLALASLVVLDDLDLRSNCELVPKPGSRVVEAIDADGNRCQLEFDRQQILDFAKEMAATMKFPASPQTFKAMSPKEVAVAVKQAAKKAKEDEAMVQ